MIKKHLRSLLITSFVILLPIVAGLMLWEQLPDQIPIHWNAEGVVDGWSSKPFAVFAMPLIMLGLHWLAVGTTLADPKRQNHGSKVKVLVFWLVPVLSVTLEAFSFLTALGKVVRVEIWCSVLLGLIFVIIGNYLPKCKQNYTVGIKLPWTLASEENWNRTHRLAGKIWVIGGILMVLLSFVSFLWVMLTVPMAMALVPLLYSYLLYRKGI